MSNKDLRTAPHSFKDEDRVWWYEEPHGITIVVRDYKERFFNIPWKTIRNALKRKDKP